MPSSSPTASSDMHRALRHYKRAIAALQGEEYRGILSALRTNLLQRLCQERDALLQQMARDGLLPERNTSDVGFRSSTLSRPGSLHLPDHSSLQR